MRLVISSLNLTIKYTYVRVKTTVCQRAIPTDLRDRYPSAAFKLILPS